MEYQRFMKTEPWEHQVRGHEFCWQRIIDCGGVGLFADMGTGKSKMNIDLIARSIAHFNAKRILIVCPKAVIPVWPQEFERHASFDYKMLIFDARDSSDSKARKAHAFWRRTEGKISVIVINYESCWRAPIGPWFMAYYRPEIIIADEGHKIKTANSKQSVFLSTLAVKSATKVKIDATGSPASSPLDYFAQFRFINPRVFGNSYIAFQNRYARLGGPERKIVVGYKNLDELNMAVNKFCFFVKADEVLDLPPYNDNIMFADMSTEARRIYKEISDDMFATLPDDLGEVNVANAMTQLTHLQQTTSGIARSTTGQMVDIDDAKLKVLREIVDGLTDNEPIVVFTRFTRDAQRVYEFLNNEHRNPCYQTGEASQWEEFQAGKFNSIVVNAQSGGTGISLTRSRIAVYYSAGLRVLDYLQSRRRLVRPGQTRPVSFYHLCVQGSVDVHIYNIYKSRLSAVAQIDEGSISDAATVREILDGMKKERDKKYEHNRERGFLAQYGRHALEMKSVQEALHGTR